MQRAAWMKTYRQEHPEASKDIVKKAWHTEHKRRQNEADKELQEQIHELTEPISETSVDNAIAQLQQLIDQNELVQWTPDQAAHAIFLASTSIGLSEKVKHAELTGSVLEVAPSLLPLPAECAHETPKVVYLNLVHFLEHGLDLDEAEALILHKALRQIAELYEAKSVWYLRLEDRRKTQLLFISSSLTLCILYMQYTLLIRICVCMYAVII